MVFLITSYTAPIVLRLLIPAMIQQSQGVLQKPYHR